MKAKRIICPVCGSEKKTISEEGNLHEYLETIVSEVCCEYEDTPEEKLLKAIFGKKAQKV